MKRKITLLATGVCLWLSSGQAQTPCANDFNGFVASKNVGATGYVQLKNGFEEKASQTYNYQGPGKIVSVRVYGNNPVLGFLSGVPLRIGVYNVDLSGKPTTPIATVNHTWWSYPDNGTGYINVTFPGGVNVNNRFALTVEIITGFPFGSTFDLKYTGNAEGLGQDLASLAGTSTGYNWTSAMTSFGKDGDFYLVPTMSNTNNPLFTTASNCYQTNGVVSFENGSQFTKDSMFNLIGSTQYMGSNYFYSWDFGDGSPVSHVTNPTHAYATGGAYTVTLTTTIVGWNAVCTRTFSKTISVGLAVSATSVVNATCFSSATGSVTAVGSFGSAPYSYNLNGGVWQSSANFTGLTAGTYTLNVKDSKGCTSSTTFTITQPASILFNTIPTTNATCGLANGAFTCVASGGVAPLQYRLNSGSFVSSGTFLNLIAATYQLTVKDANGCTVNTTVFINSQAGPSLGFPNSTNVSCFNGNDGTITLTSTGGTGAVQYSVNNGINFQSSGTFTGLTAGTYLCSVKDNAGCSSYASVVITQGQELNLTANAVSPSCHSGNNGTITVASTGGTGTHSFSVNGINYQSSNLFTNLFAGTYTVYVKDITSCIKTATVVVGQPATLTITQTLAAASCYGAATGSIQVVGVGGTSPYTYSIDDENFETSGLFENLPAGTYGVTTHDANGCERTDSLVIGQPAALTATINTTNATCTSSNGSIMVVAAGGSGSNYQYSSDGVNFSSNGLFAGLDAGTYFVVIKDGSNCKNTVSGVVASSGGPTIAASTSQNVSCHGGNDGAISVTSVTGGTGILQYSRNGINFQTSPNFTSLMAGSYIIQVKDANGCIDTIAKIITQPNAFLVVTSVSNVLCHGAATGTVNIAASGGAGFFVYSINNGFTYQSGSAFSNLEAGVYSAIIKDAANCSTTKNFIITEPSAIQLNTAVLNVTCYGQENGAITAAASGGVSPYVYSVQQGAFSTNAVFDSLQGDLFYEVRVRDANNCILTVYRFVNEPSLLNLEAEVSDVTCAGGDNGSILVAVTGGFAPYLFDWTNHVNSPVNTNLDAGTYALTVTDHNGCTGSQTFTVDEPNFPLILNANITDASAISAADGAIDITTTGGTAPYAYQWSTGVTTPDLTDLTAGAYLITVTDINDCSISTTFVVDVTSGVSDIDENQLVVYPNPSADFIQIESTEDQINQVKLYDIMGKLVFEQSINDTKYTMNVSQLSTGLYQLKLSFATGEISRRIEVRK
jgi:large repetitive protein